MKETLTNLEKLYKFIKEENISLTKFAILLELSTKEDIEKCRKFG